MVSIQGYTYSGDARFFDQQLLILQLGVDIVDVTSGKDGMVAQAQQRAVSGHHPALLEIPTRRLWAEIDSNQQWNGRDEGGA